MASGFFKRLWKGSKSPEQQLNELLGEYSLPSFPGVVVKALRVLRNPEANSREIGEVLATDPGLSIDLLRLANSAHVGTVRRLDSLSHAVSMLGRSEVEALVLSIGVRRALPSDERDGFKPKRFWQAAAQRAVAAKAFARILHPRSEMQSFTASLLQDMAIPVLVESRGKDYGDLLNQWHRGEDDLDKLERLHFPWDHGEVGSWMCARWELPEALAQAIHEHHEPHPHPEAACPPGVALVGSLREGAESPGQDLLIERAVNWYGLEADRCKALLDDAFERAEELAQLLR